jgi:hypothetical protein
MPINPTTMGFAALYPSYLLDCTPQVRHDNLGDRAVATTGYRALFCANTASNSRGD